MGPDMSALQLLSQETLIYVLNQIPGKKQLILEPSVMRPLDRIAGMSLLNKAGVENVVKLERGSPPPPPSVTSTRTYLIPSTLIQAKYVADQISATVAAGFSGKIHIILVPRKLPSISQLFEEEGLAGFVHLHEFSWEFIPLDYDLLSLELPSFFRTHYVCGDHGGLVTVARAIWGIKSLYGNIPNLFAQGSSVSKIVKLMNMFTRQYGEPKSKQSEIGHLFILERDLDWASCLLSPLTYEGLLDETFGVSCGTVEFGPEITKTDGKVKLQLSSKDRMFDKIRNKHFASIFSVLGVNAKQLAADQAKASSMNVTQMKKFVQNDLRNMQAQSKAIALHIGASEVIQREKGSYFETQLPVEHALVSALSTRDSISYIEDCLAQMRPLPSVLRLICLLAHCGDGLSPGDAARIKTQFLQAYGFQHLVTWNNLVKLGVIREKGGVPYMPSSSSLGNIAAKAAPGSSGKLGFVSQQVAGFVGAGTAGSFQALVKKLGLIPSLESELNLTDPTSPGYVFNGAFVPVSCRLVQELLKPGGATNPQIQETLKLLPGETITESRPGEAPKAALVVFVGGYTMAEVAAFRLLQTVTGYQFIIAGTNNFNGNKFVSDVEKL